MPESKKSRFIPFMMLKNISENIPVVRTGFYPVQQTKVFKFQTVCAFQPRPTGELVRAVRPGYGSLENSVSLAVWLCALDLKVECYGSLRECDVGVAFL